ncbi:MAG TPA: SIR2 family protein [Bacteroidales bacterium]|nr:SIR2 family protein [Bacteroidales bacterium]
MNIKQDEIIILLGAGASADAGIPVTSKMVQDVEEFIDSNNKCKDWSQFKDLYYLVKSSVEFSYGIQGKHVNFNIETLLNILNELEKKEMHPLYPFIGSWSVRFNEIIKDNFNLIIDFKNKIIQQLKTWIQPDNLKLSEYFKKLSEFQKQIQFPLKIFTLNYDLLIEKNLSEITIERGFDDNKKWNYKLFSERPEEPEIYLYKLHGSLDWERDTITQIVKCVDNIPDIPDLIFGTQYKMQYIDPYLFLFSEFRHYALKSKLIICIGYSFSDEHINAILSQALKNNEGTKIYSVNKDDENTQMKNIKLMLSCKESQIIIMSKTAKDFFENELKLESFNNLVESSYEDNIF